MDTYIGFDSAWTDNAKAPGAISAVCMDGSVPTKFHSPKLVSFAAALTFIKDVASPDGVTLVALDQPTLVLNAKGMRPVERVAASLISWLGGGVQPANRGRLGMFCDASPVWKFLSSLDAIEDPEETRKATRGLHLIEVFPALALVSLEASFHGRLAAPRYNPGRRKTFLPDDWRRVAGAAAAESRTFGCDELADWFRGSGDIPAPSKADQDRLDAGLCVLIALRWRLRPRNASIMIGDVREGYMVAPVNDAVRARLSTAAAKVGVAVDGTVPSVVAG